MPISYTLRHTKTISSYNVMKYKTERTKIVMKIH